MNEMPEMSARDILEAQHYKLPRSRIQKAQLNNSAIQRKVAYFVVL